MPAIFHPIKRSNSLTPFSREHHQGLLFAWKIRQGIRKAIAVERIIDFCNWFWETDLEGHFQKEEKAFDQLLHSNHPMLQQMMSEHNALRTMFGRLSANTSYEELETLAQAVNDHIRFEERKLFNEIEKVVAPEDLRNAVEQKQHHPCDEWIDEFWIYQL